MVRLRARQQHRGMTQTSHDAGEPRGFRRDGVHDLGNLRRTVAERKLAGVAGGLGRHFDVDPTVLRVVFVVLALFGGAGLLLYGACWLLVPEEGSEHAVIRTSPSTRAALLIVAAVLSAAALVSHSFGHWWFPWPLAVIAVVVLLIWMNRDKPMNQTPAAPPAPPTGGTPASQPPADGWTDGDYVVPPPPPPYSAPPSAYQPPPRRTRRGPLLFAPTLALLAVVLGTLGLYDALGGSVVAAAYPALALAVIGAMLVLGAWVGRPGGLIALGLAAAVALMGTSVAGAPFTSNRHLDPRLTSAAAVHDSYFLPAGEIRLDLTRVADPADLNGRQISAHTRAGTVTVVLPPGVRAHVVADVSVGEVSLAGTRSGGTQLHVVRDVGTGSTTVDLHLGTNVGRVEVFQNKPALPQSLGRQTAGLLSQGAA